MGQPVKGEILHRNSLGYTRATRPGAVDLRTAEKGFVHSERTSKEWLRTGQRLHGLQVWMALPALNRVGQWSESAGKGREHWRRGPGSAGDVLEFLSYVRGEN
jgi:hypothetical protein